MKENIEINNQTFVVCVSSCPTGVAHTFMAAAALEKAAEQLNFKIKVQKNASQGIINSLTPDEIAKASYVIIASDIKVNLTPFLGKKIYFTSTKKALSNSKEILKAGANAPVYELTKKKGSFNFFKEKQKLYQHLLTGISFMLPFVVAGGILTAVSLFWGIHSYDKAYPEYNTFAASLHAIGNAGMELLVPALAGYIAYSIGDRPAIVPGFIGGYLAKNGFDGLSQKIGGNNVAYTSGFLGAIVAGLVAGYLIQFLRVISKPIPEKFNAVKSMVIFPVFATVITGLAVIWVFNYPIGKLQDLLNKGLENIGGTQSGTSIGASIVLGIILGALIATDFGGPFNKVAYLFGVANLTQGKSIIMASVSAACMTPALATAFAVTFFPHKYTPDEKSAGYTNYILGATHITEGAIPFAAKKPLVNIPIFMIGSIIACAASLLLGCATTAPHGGFLILPLVDKWYYWFLVTIGGSLISGLLLGLVTPKITTTKNNKQDPMFSQKFINILRKPFNISKALAKQKK